MPNREAASAAVAEVAAAQPNQTRSLLFRDYNDWYELRSLLLRLSYWKVGMEPRPIISAGDVMSAGRYAERMNDIDCTFTLKEVQEMGWTPPGGSEYATRLADALCGEFVAYLEQECRHDFLKAQHVVRACLEQADAITDPPAVARVEGTRND